MNTGIGTDVPSPGSIFWRRAGVTVGVGDTPNLLKHSFTCFR